VVVLLAWLALRSVAVGGAPSPPNTTPFASRLVTGLGTIPRYLGVFVAPIDLHMERSVPVVHSPVDGWFLGSLGLLAATLAVVVRCWRTAPPLACGLAWFLVALLPVTGIAPLAATMAEHWLYVPSMGLCLAIGWLVGRWPRVALPIAGSAIVVLGAMTMRRNRDWRDELTLFEATRPLAPASIRVLAGLGHAYKDRGDLDRAVDAYARALALTPPPDQASSIHNNLGNIERQENKLDDAERDLRQALVLNPSNVEAYNNLAVVLLIGGRADDAERVLDQALAANPNVASTYTNLGAIYANRQELDRARQAFESAIRLDPDSGDAHNDLGSLYRMRGERALAEREFREALRCDPASAQFRRNLDALLAESR
jgi:Tfp pilus assembly protein PilF